MPKILTRGGQDYHLDVDFRPDMDTVAHVAVTVSRVPAGKSPSSPDAEHIQAVAKVEEHLGEPHLIVTIQDSEVYREPLATILGGDSVVDAIPGWAFGMGEPIVGCLLRGGISAAVDQIKTCWAETRMDRPPFYARVEHAIDCLRQNIKGVGLRAAIRAGICIARGGN